jgi:hypothetical protein
LTAGILGAGLGVSLGYCLRVDFLHKPMVFWGMLGSGVLYGLMAPFLAPLQVRHPRILTTVSLVSFVGIFLVMDFYHLRGPLAGLGLAFIFAFLLLWSTSLSEALAGPRTWLAEKVRGLAGAFRYLMTWLGFLVGFSLLAYLDSGHWPRMGMLRDILSVSLVVVASGGTAMETGKQAFTRAIGARCPRLPSGSRGYQSSQS